MSDNFDPTFNKITWDNHTQKNNFYSASSGQFILREPLYH